MQARASEILKFEDVQTLLKKNTQKTRYLETFLAFQNVETARQLRIAPDNYKVYNICGRDLGTYLRCWNQVIKKLRGLC